jgi:hypothetical protein
MCGWPKKGSEQLTKPTQRYTLFYYRKAGGSISRPSCGKVAEPIEIWISLNIHIWFIE